MTGYSSYRSGIGVNCGFAFTLSLECAKMLLVQRIEPFFLFLMNLLLVLCSSDNSSVDVLDSEYKGNYLLFSSGELDGFSAAIAASFNKTLHADPKSYAYFETLRYNATKSI